MSLMLREIREQPEALERTLADQRRGAEQLRTYLGRHPPRLVMIAARGTSDNAAQFGRYLIEITTGMPVALAAPSVFTLYQAPMKLEGVLLLAISQSGESTDTNMVLERARDEGALTIGITNEPSSKLARLAQHTFLVRAGTEQSVAATKTYTGQLIILYLIAWALSAGIDLEKLALIPDFTRRTLTLESEVAARSERYRFMEHAVVIGRGLNYSNAFEFALKLMETCYVVAERFSAADLMHGPIAMVGHSFPTFSFAPSGPTWPGMRDVLSRIEQLKAETLVITDESNRDAALVSPRVIRVPMELEELYTPIPYIVPAQLFAAYLAEQKGLDPDQPRTLTKVTRTL